MSLEMPKFIGTLGGPSCTYLVGQNLHNQTHPNECPYTFEKDSRQITDMGALTAIVCPAARPLGQRQIREPLSAERWNTFPVDNCK